MNDYVPNSQQQKQLDLLFNILSEAKKVNIEIAVVGGYGLDALYGKLTRDHRDFDMYVHRVDQQKMKKILLSYGFIPTGEIIGDIKKIELASKEFENFTIEYGFIENALMGFTDEEIKEYIPNNCIGSLDGISIFTPSFAGFKKIIEINNMLAKKNNNLDYPHKEWMENILVELEKKNH